MGRAFPQRGGRAMDEHSEVFVGLAVAKARHAVAVAVADGRRRGEVRCPSENDADSTSVRRMVALLESGIRMCISAKRPVLLAIASIAN